MKKNIRRQLYFRPMKVADLPYVMVIENRSYTAPWQEDLYRQELRNPSGHYTVAILQGKIVGYAGLRINGDQAHLMTMVVDPDYRGLGVGDAILDYKLNLVKQKRARSIILEVRVSNIGAQKLYKKYGFVQTGVREQYYPDNLESAFMMKLDLTPALNNSAYGCYGLY